ncbi:aminotransferase-like domain-containing protein [Bradyrhizobium mercantei]|uniref:aminotransferase-like domain-containing protein n=1 Tax=Bradyrhizobium mercantei TaxID=1904807 RepID=UPI0009788B0D|nr:PLP-dependent aminotransferase family protein [Bradyrhizobium mercantei]
MTTPYLARNVESDAVRPAFANWLSSTNDLTSRFVAAERVPGLINIAGGLPAPETFPVEELAALSQAVVREFPRDSLGYGPTDGLVELRDAIASRFSTQSLRLDRSNVLITAGGTQALDLIGKVLLEAGGVVAGEFPMYAGALDAWRPRQPRYHCLRAEAGDLDLSSAKAQFVYAVPNFSNPTGKLVGLAARRALVDAAHRTGVWIVEDDPYGSLYYDETPLPRLIELSADLAPGEAYRGPVVYLGTFSKELVPGLRVAWAIGSPDIIQALTTAKQSAALCSNGMAQRIALAAMRGGLTERMRPKLLGLYRERRDALAAAMDEHLSDWFEWDVPVGGMFIWATARDRSLDTDAVVSAGLKTGVLVAPGRVFDPQGEDRSGLRLNFTLNPPDRLDEAVRRLGAAMRLLYEQVA